MPIQAAACPAFRLFGIKTANIDGLYGYQFEDWVHESESGDWKEQLFNKVVLLRFSGKKVLGVYMYSKGPELSVDFDDIEAFIKEVLPTL